MTMQLEKLEEYLLGQPFSLSEPDAMIGHYRQVAGMYALLENGIAVLSDLRENRSYIYSGALAVTLGLPAEITGTVIDSIWEEEVYARVHPDDLRERHLLELRFFHLVRKYPIDKRGNLRTQSIIRMRNREGEYIPVLHRTFYLKSTSNGSLWLDMCLYNFLADADADSGFRGIIQNTETGEIIMSGEAERDEILSVREREVLSLIGQGLRSKEIAVRLGISKNTVDRHRQNIMEKLRAGNSIEAIGIARSLNLLSGDSVR